MKLSVKQALLEKHDIPTLKEALQAMKDMETVDFNMEKNKI